MTGLAFEGVSKSYWRGEREILVLRDVSFRLEPGDFAAVLGDRRAGKTTLLRIAAGLDMADQGSVTFRGQPFDGMSDRRRAELWNGELACVWGGRVWTARRVIDAVSVPLLGAGASPRRARRLAYEELRRWDVHDAANALLHQLSDAERQRVAFAHALVRRPSVLLADDPTETLNIMERNHVLARLQRAVHDDRMAVLTTTTDASGAAGINRLLALRGDGELLEAQSLQPAPVVPLRSRTRSSHDA
jgi:ABC-type lipoprotein export system ATPase subunit